MVAQLRRGKAPKDGQVGFTNTNKWVEWKNKTGGCACVCLVLQAYGRCQVPEIPWVLWSVLDMIHAKHCQALPKQCITGPWVRFDPVAQLLT